MPGKDFWRKGWHIWEQGKGYREPTEAERAEAARRHREQLERLEKLREELARASIAGGRFGAVVRNAITILRLDPPLEWEDGCEQMDFNEWVADVLERTYFSTPAQTKARRLARQRNECRGYRDLIDIVAIREGISEAKALAKVAEESNTTPEALKKKLQRDRKQHGDHARPDPGWRALSAKK